MSVPVWGGNVSIKPEAKLTSLSNPLRPTESSLEPLRGKRCGARVACTTL